MDDGGKGGCRRVVGVVEFGERRQGLKVVEEGSGDGGQGGECFAECHLRIWEWSWALEWGVNVGGGLWSFREEMSILLQT